MNRKLLHALRTFCDDRRGVAAIEFAIVTPLMLFLMLGSMELFYMFRASQHAENATFTLGDIISRQNTVDTGFLDTMQASFTGLIGNAGSDSIIRVTSIKNVGGELSVDWSYATAPLQPLCNCDALPTDIIPDIADGDSIILTETQSGFLPIVTVLRLPLLSNTHYSVNRPRFVSAIARTG